MARAVARRCRVPLIHTCHTVYEDYTHYFSPCVRVGRGLAARFMRRTASKTDAVIAPTEKVRQLLLSYGIDTPIAVIPTGTEPQESAPPEQSADLRCAFGIAEGKRVLLYLGRPEKEKNLPALLHLAEHPKLRDTVPVFVGDGPYRAEPERQARLPELRDRVRFVGAVPHSEVARYYRLGDVFVNASASETQGLTYAEAMAAGVPVVCKSDPCVSGLLESGRNGFACTDEDEMADAIERLFNDGDLRREIVGAARETVGRGYTSAVFAAAVEALYLCTAERLAKEMTLYGIEKGKEG
ncbi:MAG TPA: glycosyltransferase family 4 protein [Clostridiales bacterium]|nr:glycosyltransferase family 4 protein [Clostridiales bacterium]